MQGSVPLDDSCHLFIRLMTDSALSRLIKEVRHILIPLILTLARCASVILKNRPAQPVTSDWKQRYLKLTFPAIVSPWVATSDLPDTKVLDCRHDPQLRGLEDVGLKPNNSYVGLSDGFEMPSIAGALERRRKLLACNPHAILVAEIRYRDAGPRYLPPNSPWWKRDQKGSPQVGYAEGPLFLLDYDNTDFQDQITPSVCRRSSDWSF